MSIGCTRFCHWDNVAKGTLLEVLLRCHPNDTTSCCPSNNTNIYARKNIGTLSKVFSRDSSIPFKCFKKGSNGIFIGHSYTQFPPKMPQCCPSYIQ